MLRPAIVFSLCLDYQRGLFPNEAWCASRVQSETSVVESAELTLAIFESWTDARLQDNLSPERSAGSILSRFPLIREFDDAKVLGLFTIP